MTTPWSERLNTGHGEMDAEHELQIELIDALHEAVERGADMDDLQDILEKLTDYTTAHFLGEQLLMRQQGYPEFQSHVEEHDRLLKQLEQLGEAVGAGGEELTLQLCEEIREWLAHHVQGPDQQFADYALAHGKTGRHGA